MISCNPLEGRGRRSSSSTGRGLLATRQCSSLKKIILSCILLRNTVQLPTIFILVPALAVGGEIFPQSPVSHFILELSGLVQPGLHCSDVELGHQLDGLHDVLHLTLYHPDHGAVSQHSVGTKQEEKVGKSRDSHAKIGAGVHRQFISELFTFPTKGVKRTKTLLDAEARSEDNNIQLDVLLGCFYSLGVNLLDLISNQVAVFLLEDWDEVWSQENPLAANFIIWIIIINIIADQLLSFNLE